MISLSKNDLPVPANKVWSGFEDDNARLLNF